MNTHDSSALTANALCEQLLPKPREVRDGRGQLVLGNATLALQVRGSCSADIHAAYGEFVNTWGGDLDSGSVAVRVNCEFSRDHLPVVKMNEHYRLCIDTEGIHIDAQENAGLLRALSTLQQILAQARAVDRRSLALPCLTIDDSPRYPWRGLMLDCARHFLPLDDLLRTLRGMAFFKLNVLHLHLTDDQAFRFPSDAYPELNAAGEVYSKAELLRLVEVATALGIRVVPEIDMPGHTTSWLAAYPEWSLYPVTPSTRFGVHRGCLNPCAETTFEVIGVLLDELGAVFPDTYVHIGGDEVHPSWWGEHPDVQAFMRERSMIEVADLQNYFNGRVVEMLAQRNKRALGWDEVLHKNLDRDVCVQSWRGACARDAAIDAGHACIVSAPYYLDLFYPADLHTVLAPDLPLADALAQEDALRLDPRLAHVAEGIAWTDQWRDRAALPAASEAGELLGAEACLWGELVSAELLDVRLWSRMPLLAELFWRGEVATTDYAQLGGAVEGWHHWGGPDIAQAFSGALSPDQLTQLQALGVDDSLIDLVSVVEPVKWYARLLGEQALRARLMGTEMPQARPYQTDTPLNGLADIVSPQSGVACAFAELLARWQTAGLSAADNEQLTQWLAAWARAAHALGDAKLDSALNSNLAELAQRLRRFAELIQEQLLPHANKALTHKRLARVQPAELQALQEPVGELLLGCVAPLLACLNLTAHQ